MITKKDILEAIGAETDDRFTSGMLIGIGVGAIVGSALAMLFAPKAGSEMRQMIGERGTEMIAGIEEDGQRRSMILEGLKVLDTRERAIIRARHMRQRPATLAWLGKKFGISRERVRQLELRAKAKLRQYVDVDGSLVGLPLEA